MPHVRDSLRCHSLSVMVVGVTVSACGIFCQLVYAQVLPTYQQNSDSTFCVLNHNWRHFAYQKLERYLHSSSIIKSRYAWLVGPRGSEVEHQSLVSVLSPSCAQPVADG